VIGPAGAYEATLDADREGGAISAIEWCCER
jgi:hypothetical protein